ncbi:hypothetical protein G9F71_025445 [Clostridium sp. FP2]|uniref:hypothetical protein n=1 Tax=Clostridium sp. FP2 TaxID=2724481 RepID=UPI0013E97CBC|nr:hypothetical protein [Clostridium sp. FP2]MBZ9626154.1 hypothetical protein [Clostridium sp. FP2]
MTKKKKIIFSSIILFIVMIIIVCYASYNYIFKNKYTIYIPKSLTTNLYSTKDSNCYKDINLEHLSVFWSNPYSQQFYDDTQESKEKGKKILDYLNEFNIKEIHPVKFLNNDTPKKNFSIIFYYKDRFIYLYYPNKFVFTIKIVGKDDTENSQTIERAYLIKDNYIDDNKIESLLKN